MTVEAWVICVVKEELEMLVVVIIARDVLVTVVNCWLLAFGVSHKVEADKTKRMEITVRVNAECFKVMCRFNWIAS